MTNKEPLKVLILDRSINPTVWADNLYLADSSGTRNVWFYSPKGDYDHAKDFPLDIFKQIEEHCSNLKKAGSRLTICMRRDDPGLGIFIPEIDLPALTTN